MLKNTLISLTLILTLSTYGQKSTLLKNVNYRAKELKQSLSKNGDSLILEGERRIYSVEIFNQDFEKIIQVEGNRTKIALNDIPLGRLVVEAKLIDKRILITLLRHENINERQNIPKQNMLNTHLASKSISKNLHIDNSIAFNSNIKPMYNTRAKVQDDANTNDTFEKPNLLDANKPKYIDRHAQLLSGKLRKPAPKINHYYWIKYEINNGNTSQKSMRLVNQKMVDKLISKHQLEIKTERGKYNKLTIWEVYNKKEFMKEQVSNPDYINISKSNYFNTSTYYASENTIE